MSNGKSKATAVVVTVKDRQRPGGEVVVHKTKNPGRAATKREAKNGPIEPSKNGFHAGASWGATGINGNIDWEPSKAGFDVNPTIHPRHVAALREAKKLSKTDDRLLPIDELITTISGSTNFAVTSYDINPGLSTTFPVSSAIAQLYQGYVYGRLTFYYKPRVTVYTSQGKIMMSCDLEGLQESDPASVAEMENNSIHSDGMPHQRIGFDVAGVTRKRDYSFVRDGPVPVGADPKLCDVGRLYVATSGTPTGVIGELRVKGTLVLKDILQEIERFALPYWSAQYFFDYIASVGSGGNQTLTVTDTAPTAIPPGYPAGPLAAVVPMDLSGWSISGGSAIAPVSAVYRVTINLWISTTSTVNYFVANGSTTPLLTITVDGVRACIIMPCSTNIGAGGGTTLETWLQFAGSFNIPMNRGQSLSAILSCITDTAAPYICWGGVVLLDTI